MQPKEFFAMFGAKNIPEYLTLGTSPEMATVRIPIKKANKHIILRGQTSSGKSRTLALLVMQLMAAGKRVIFIDPLGEVYSLVLNWMAYLTRQSYLKGKKDFDWMNGTILPNIVFCDLSDKKHLFRHNMGMPFEGEDFSDVVARQIKFFNAFLGTESGNGMDLQLQRRDNYFNLIRIFVASETPLDEGLNFIYDRGFREKLYRQAVQRKPMKEIREAVAHFQYLEEEFKSRMAEKLNSLETALSPFFENTGVRNFLLAPNRNIDFQKIFREQSCIIKTDSSDLATKRLLLTYLYSLFLDLADKKSSKVQDVYLGSDESALVFGPMLADYITRIRNKKVYIISSHQSLGQMLTEEGIRIAETIESQSAIRMYFRHDYKEAVGVVNEIFNPQGKQPKLIEMTTTISRNASESAGKSISEAFSQERSAGISHNFQDGITNTETRSYSISDTHSISEGISKSWSESLGFNQVETWSVQDAFTYSESAGKTLSQISGSGVSFTMGENRSLMRIETESGVVSIGESQGRTETQSDSYGESKGEGSSDSYTVSDGEGYTTNYSINNGGQSISIVQGAPIAIGSAPDPRVSTGIQDFTNTAKSNAHIYNQSKQTMRGMAESLSKMSNKGSAHGKGIGVSNTLSEQEAIGLTRQFSEAVALSKQYARAIQKSLGHSQAYGKSTTSTQTIGNSSNIQISRALQQGEALARTTAQNYGVSASQSTGDGVSSAKQQSLTTSTGTSVSISWRLLYYSIIEEKELLAQEVRSLPQRYFHLNFENQTIQVRTADCLELPTAFGDYNFLKILWEYYRRLPEEKDRRLKLEIKALPAEEFKEVKIYPTLSDDKAIEDFSHFFDAGEDEAKF